MLENLVDLRKGLKHILTLERLGQMEEAANFYEATFKPSLEAVAQRMGKSAQEVRNLLQATPNRKHRVDFN